MTMHALTQEGTAEVGRRLSEAQRQHLTQLILAMRVAAAKLDAANSIMQAQVESAQKEFDGAQDAANAFLRYCGNEHQVTFDDGLWGFDEQLMCFVRRVLEQPPPSVPVGTSVVAEQAEASEAVPMNGVEHAAHLT
jgi:hypothetical protein